MKHFNILAVTLLLLANGPKMCAQTENGFKEIDVANDFGDNPFTFFANAPILAATDSTGNGYNAMTIGWGDAGTLWGKPIMTVYVERMEEIEDRIFVAIHSSSAASFDSGGWYKPE